MIKKGDTSARRDERMLRVGTSKITKLCAKPGIVYPLIRLLKAYAEEIGKTANIFEIQNDKQRALFVTFGELSKADSAVVQLEPEVIQLEPEVIQPYDVRDVKAYLLELESQIAELKSLLLKNKIQKAPQSPLLCQSTSKILWARPDSDRQPPPCEDGGFWLL
jgi:hypothetical protein